ncbi:MAG: PmoA family protein [Candidatus Glassbacteria bacterium]|nr:PmoA family protein [Candidatus Glassbacteria bacterium]
MPVHHVEITHNQAARQLDVAVDGHPFTSYCYWEKLKKPVLYPLRTSDGRVVTRSFPVEMVPGERVDHPHHLSCWFNYGDVNGDDYWNNSDAVDPAGKYGRIVHRSAEGIVSRPGLAWFDAGMDWISSAGEKVLDERDRIYFRAAGDLRMIDRIIKLTAQDRPVVFGDSKEGMLGIRASRQLEEPSDEPQKYVDSSGKVTDVGLMDNTGVDGEYLASSGLVGSGQVWGTRAKWCLLQGTVKGLPATVGIFDHPDNVAYPTYWHARGYGLFAANPLGWKAFTDGRKELKFSLQPGESAVFRFRILISSRRLEALETEKLFMQWLQDTGEE